MGVFDLARDSSKPHWRHRVEMDMSDRYLLGEDENGDLWVPTYGVYGTPWWGKRFNPWNPSHWRYWMRSRRKLRLAMLESQREA